MSEVILSIGSNQGDSLKYLQSVVAALGERLRKHSSVYRTSPLGFLDQPDFLNAILVARDEKNTALDWLNFARICEQQANREHIFKNSPRTLDVDIVEYRTKSYSKFYNENWKSEWLETPNLTLPHPRAKERLFVLLPWLEIEPQATLAIGFNHRVSIKNLAQPLLNRSNQKVQKTNLELKNFK